MTTHGKVVILNGAQAYDAMYLFVSEFLKKDGGKSDVPRLLKCLEYGRWGDGEPSTTGWHECTKRIADGFNPYPPPP